MDHDNPSCIFAILQDNSDRTITTDPLVLRKNYACYMRNSKAIAVIVTPDELRQNESDRKHSANAPHLFAESCGDQKFIMQKVYEAPESP